MKTQPHSVEISPKLKAQFEADGYCVVPGLYSPEEVEPVHRRMEEFWEGRHAYSWPNANLSTTDPQERNTPEATTAAALSSYPRP